MEQANLTEKKIYLVRHCSAHGQHRDSPLTTNGLQQANQLAEFFSNLDEEIDHIISSPYLRAVDSIKPFANKAQLTIHVDERLKERILSEDPIDDWLDVLEHSFQELDFSLPGGESSNDAIERAHEVIDQMKSTTFHNIVIVSHGNLLSLLLHRYDQAFGFDTWKAMQNPDVYTLQLGRQIVRPVQVDWKSDL
ncbi:histidine phosphatase family protein [Virgibacillus sp. AGTR]|uniref:histidine phosphatase family protein n=1 Tax=Virgibacillus sp. AGTR TaxID=2812055 RepID=UPI001962A8F7|nr:histidine phosphatase family protein [Virgibacillus sp. AGTR]MCC2250875.1 histidine phosphatase family protein [Virgibacillus sp. AGTR]QRZ17081.1 histidine phosphatase family protein [Virgibacillus sp. AGTR]